MSKDNLEKRSSEPTRRDFLRQGMKIAGSAIGVAALVKYEAGLDNTYAGLKQVTSGRSDSSGDASSEQEEHCPCGPDICGPDKPRCGPYTKPYTLSSSLENLSGGESITSGSEHPCCPCYPPPGPCPPSKVCAPEVRLYTK